MTTMPSMRTVSSIRRIASTAAWSAASFSPRPTQRAAAMAPYSVTRTSSRARLRSGRALEGPVVRWSDAGRPNLDVLGLAPEAAPGDEERADEPDVVADLERYVDVVVAVPAGRAEDDAVEQDQGERDHHDDHRDLAGSPLELISARDDPGQDERRETREDERPANVLVDAEAGELAVLGALAGSEPD